MSSRVDEIHLLLLELLTYVIGFVVEHSLMRVLWIFCDLLFN